MHKKSTRKAQARHARTTSKPRANHEQTMSKQRANNERTMSEPRANHKRTTRKPLANHERTQCKPQANDVKMVKLSLCHILRPAPLRFTFPSSTLLSFLFLSVVCYFRFHFYAQSMTPQPATGACTFTLHLSPLPCAVLNRYPCAREAGTSWNKALTYDPRARWPGRGGDYD
jgi:hypothetical protein